MHGWHGVLPADPIFRRLVTVNWNCKHNWNVTKPGLKPTLVSGPASAVPQLERRCLAALFRKGNLKILRRFCYTFVLQLFWVNLAKNIVWGCGGAGLLRVWFHLMFGAIFYFLINE